MSGAWLLVLVVAAAPAAKPAPQAPLQIPRRGVPQRGVPQGESPKGSPPRGGFARFAPGGDCSTGFQPLDIHADHLTVLTQDHRGVWTGHVHAVRPATPADPQLDLRCDRLITDLAGDQKLQRATCTGNVSVVQGDRLGWGDHAVYDAGTGQLVVTGHPRGQQGPNRFRGDSLTFFVSGDRIEVVHPVVDTPAPRALAKSAPPSAQAPDAGGAP